MATSRRTFLTGRGIAIRLTGAQALGRPVDAHGRPHPGPHGRADHDTSYTELDLVSGAVHYWRLDRADWRACLTAMKQLGLRIVDTPIPWGVHERRAGRHDWSKERDLAAFLDQVARAGMYAIVRPGPHAGGELTGDALPARIRARAELLALSGRGTPVWIPAAPRMFPLPSHAAAGFQEEVGAWYAAVGEIVAPRLAPDGPVVAVQLGHEAQMLDRVGAFEHDYHPDALAWWREHSGHDEAPRAWDAADAARCVDWIMFREVYLARTMRWLGEAMDRAGVHGIVRFHGLPWTDPGRIDLPGVQAALGTNGSAGMRVDARAVGYETCRRRALYLVGSADPLPIASDVPAGGPAWGVPALEPTPEISQQSLLLGLLAAGVRGFDLHMAVERDRWYGAPISEVGETREPTPWIQRLLAALADVEWTGLRRDVPIALIAARADARFAAATSTLGPMLPLLRTLTGSALFHGTALGRDAGAADQRRWMEAVERALAVAQVPYVIVDETCAVEHLARFRAVVVPTIDRVRRDTWRNLHALAGHGKIVIVGPGKPTRDERGQPLGADATLPAKAGMIRTASADDLEGLADDLAAVAGDLPDLWITAEQTDVDCSVFVDGGGVARVLFVGNRGGGDITADVLVPAGTVLIDPLGDEELTAGVEGTVDVPLAPQQVRMFVIEQ